MKPHPKLAMQMKRYFKNSVNKIIFLPFQLPKLKIVSFSTESSHYWIY